MGEVVTFKGKTINRVEPDNVLEGAKGKLEEVIVMGWEKSEDGKSGEAYFASSTADGGDVLWLLECLKRIILGY